MSNHRADTRSRHLVSPGRRAPGGKRKTVKPLHLTGLPIATPALLPGIAGALAITAAAGATVASASTAGASVSNVGGTVPAPTLAEYDTLGVSRSIDARQHAMSRDSDRLAAQTARQRRSTQAVEVQADSRSETLGKLQAAATKQAAVIKARNTWVLPTTGYRLTGRFGQSSGLWANNHTGLDFATTPGTPIVAVAGGTITETGWAGSYGNRTIETLPDGTELWYAHQLNIDVEPGDVVRAGQQIGEVGSTGNSTGPHVHLEVRPGGRDPVDPFTALVYHGLRP